MFQLIYVSQATTSLQLDEIENILEASRTHNQVDQVTGMLMYKDRLFVQILEGERDHVFSVYDRVKHDTRHQGVHIIEELEVTERQFDQWIMGFKFLTQDDLIKIIHPLSSLEDVVVDFTEVIKDPQLVRDILLSAK